MDKNPMHYPLYANVNPNRIYYNFGLAYLASPRSHTPKMELCLEVDMQSRARPLSLVLKSGASALLVLLLDRHV